MIGLTSWTVVALVFRRTKNISNELSGMANAIRRVVVGTVAVTYPSLFFEGKTYYDQVSFHLPRPS
jgi:hypothetical protein